MPSAQGPSVQGAFVWEGELAGSGLPGIYLQVSTPDWHYKVTDTSGGMVVRQAQASPATHARSYLRHDDKAHGTSIGPIGVCGTDSSGNALFLRYLGQRLASMGGGVGDLSDLTFPVQLGLSAMNGELLATAEQAALIFLKGLYQPGNRDFAQVTEAWIAGHSPAGLAARIGRDAFWVHAGAYEALLAEIKAVAGSTVNHYDLLPVLALLVDLSSGRPALDPQPSAADLDTVQQILYNLEVPDPAAMLARIKSAFAGLFDFAVSTRDVLCQEVAGTLALKTADARAITAADIGLYDLSLEFNTFDEDGQPVQAVLHHDWAAAVPGLAGDTASFAFSQAQAVFPASADSTLGVYLRSADGLVLWARDYKVGHPALKALRIVVPMIGAGALSPAERALGAAGGKRLRGQLLDLSRKAVLKDTLVAVQAKTATDAAWRVVASAAADAAGNFSMPYPLGVFVAAQALVSLMPDSPVAVAVHADAGGGRTLAEDFLFLLLKDPPPCAPADPAAGSESCDCDETRAARLPDQADLIHSDEYTQDLGNGCLNLSTPNRTLREYSYQAIVRTSDPDVANYRLEKDEDGRYQLVGDNKLIKRRAIGLNNPIRWQDSPAQGDTTHFYQTVSVATGHVLHYRSQFRADGYSLGDLLYSLPLAPGQKKQLVIFDSSHALQAGESQQLSVAERLSASLVNDRDIADQLGGSISEGLRGRSSASTEGVSVGLGASANMGSAGASLGVAGGYANSHSDAQQDSARNLSQFFAEKLRNNLTQNADSYRQQNASVVTTVGENQRYSATTEVVANHNHCHSMTMMYFEVLRHYAIFQELAGVEECVFVPLLMTHFTADNIYKWQDVLAPHLLPLPSNTYLPSVDGQHPLARAFDAVTRIKTDYRDLDFPLGRLSQEPIRFISGQLQVTVNLPRPKTKYDRILSLPLIDTTVSHREFDPVQQMKNILAGPFTFGLSMAGGPAMKTVTETIQVRAHLFDQFMALDANYQQVPPAQAVRVTNFGEVSTAVPALLLPDGVNGGVLTLSRERFFDGNELDRRQWEAYATLLGYDDVFKFLGAYFKGKLISEWDTIFYNDIAPALFEKIIDKLNFSAGKPERRPAPGAAGLPANQMVGLAADFSSPARYTGGTASLTLQVRGTSTLTREQIPDLLYLCCAAPVANLGDAVTFRLENLTLRYTTAHCTQLLFSGYLGDDVQDGTALYLPLTSDDQRYPRREDRVLADKLIEHLNSNLEYYNKLLWFKLDADRRYLLLDGFNIQVYNDFGAPVGLKSLASVVKNELLTVAGNALVMPVAAGLKVSRSYIVEKTETGAPEKVSLLDHYKPAAPMPPYRLSVPTRGVFAEAMMGRCNACERVQADSSQDWAKFGTDTPTGINNLTPAAAVTTDWRANYRELVAPLVGMQKAPDAPAVGAGLAGLSDALTKSSGFKDITGLDKNQSNAVDTYKANNEAMVKMAEVAKTMAGQTHNTENADKIMGNLKTAKDDGAISHADYAGLVKQHLGQQIDGGDAERRKGEAEQRAEDKKVEKPTLTDAAVQAVSQGKQVEAAEIDHKGTTRKLQVRPDPQAAPRPAVKKFYKTVVFKALDCYGDIMQSEFHVTVHDIGSGQEVGYDVFEFGTGTIRVGTNTAAPTLQVTVAAPNQEDAVSPILTAFRMESDTAVVPEAQLALNVLLKQQPQKVVIQTKDTVLTGEKVLKELTGELSGGTSGKGGTSGGGKSFEVNANLAMKIAGKWSKEVSTTTGHDDGRSFELIVPTDHYDLSLK